MEMKQPSKRALDRIRQHGGIPEEDLAVLRMWLRLHEVVNQEVVETIERLGYTPAQRVKTLNTMVDKVRRQPRMRLSQVQDIAGVRVVVHGGLRDQDAVCGDIRAAFPQSPRVHDRRTNPSHGYRAVHLVVRHGGCLAEVQVRTLLQHRWAEVYERLADRWGRGMRYGDPPRGRQRAAVVDDLIRLSVLIRHLEEREAEVSDATAASEEAPEDPLHDALAEMRLSREWLKEQLEIIVEAVKS